MKIYSGRRSRWPMFFKLSAKTRGVIVNHVTASGCGYFITASVSVIETDKKDTITVTGAFVIHTKNSIKGIA